MHLSPEARTALALSHSHRRISLAAATVLAAGAGAKSVHAPAPPVPHKDFSDLYEKMSGKRASASEAHGVALLQAVTLRAFSRVFSTVRRLLAVPSADRRGTGRRES